MPSSMQSPSGRPDAGARRVAMYRREIAERAGLMYRLGYPAERAIARICANLDWDFERGDRPDALAPAAIAALVRETYARRPSHGL